LEARIGIRSVQLFAAQIQIVIEAEDLDWPGVIEFEGLAMVI
jgi:hypothetical protein